MPNIDEVKEDYPACIVPTCIFTELEWDLVRKKPEKDANLIRNRNFVKKMFGDTY